MTMHEIDKAAEVYLEPCQTLWLRFLRFLRFFNSIKSSGIENWHGSKYTSQVQRFYIIVFDITIKSTKSAAAGANCSLRAWFFSSVLWAKGEGVVF